MDGVAGLGCIDCTSRFPEQILSLYSKAYIQLVPSYTELHDKPTLVSVTLVWIMAETSLIH